MLQFETGKRNGGFVLWGDYGTLKPLHTFMMDLSEKSVVLESEGLIPALAYDIRKAYEGQREKDKTKVWDDEITIYGVEQVWPTFILQVALLRTGLGFVDSSKEDQSIMYNLESFLEIAIENSFPREHLKILQSYRRLIGTQEKFVTDVIGSRVAYFLSQSATKRKQHLAEILSSLDSMWTSMHSIIGAERMRASVTPQDFEGYSWESLDAMDPKSYRL